MSDIALFVLLGILGVLSLPFLITSFARYKTKMISSRTFFYFIGLLSATTLYLFALTTISGVVILIEALAVFYGLFSLLLACYVARLLIVLNDFKLGWFYKNLPKMLFALFGATGTLSLAAIPATYLLAVTPSPKTETSALVLSATMVVFHLFLYALAASAFYFSGNDGFRLKRETFSVTTIGIVCWIGSLVFVAINGVLNKNSLTLYFSLMTVGMALIYYFYCILPVALSFRKSHNGDIYNRSRFISEMLLESEESFDRELLNPNQCLEAILILKEVQSMLSKKDITLKVYKENVETIYSQFLGPKANFDITVPKTMVENLKTQIENLDYVDEHIFDQILDHIWNNIIIPTSQQSDNNKQRSKKFSKIGNNISKIALWN